jgi:heme exporter protein C
MQKQSVKLTILDVVSIVLLAATLVIVFFFTPLEETMGAVQKVFYMHVSAAWVGMLGFLTAAVCGGLYLAKRETRWDVMSETGVEIGLVFTLVGIVSGSIWAKPVWNTWWTWDPRLTTSAVMVLIYLAYQMLRSGLDDPGRRARYSAVYAIAGFVTVPLTFFSIRMFRTIHPVVVGGSSGMFAMDQAMLTAFIVSLTAFTVLFIDLFWHRYLLGSQSEELEELEAGRFGESL